MSGGRDVSGLSFAVCRSEEPSSQRQAENDKPQTTVPRAFLTDFGLAKSVATGSRLTKTGEALGTPAYMSPEQARGEVSALTPATDVWSLGCVLYEMLAGKTPFLSETTAAVVAALLAREPPRLCAVRDDLPRSLERVVRVGLSKRPRDRHRDAGVMHDDLDRILRGERPLTTLPGSRARRGLLAAGVASLLVAGTAALLPSAAVAPQPLAAAPGPSSAEALAARALAIRATRPDEAEEALRRALEAEPRRAGWRIERGLLLWALGKGREAVEEWRRVPAGGSESPWARLYECLEAYFRFQAPEHWSELHRLGEDTGLAGRLARAALKASRQEWAGARGELRELPGWEAALLRAYVESRDPGGDPHAALREYTAALDQGVPFAWAFYSRGNVRRALGDLPGAIEDYGKALELEPGHAPAWSNRGTLRHLRGDHAGAIEDLGKALELDPKHVTAWSNRGAARSSLDDHAGAIEDYGKALELDPRHGESWFDRGLLRYWQGDLVGAVADYDQALALNPRNAEAWTNRGAVLEDQGDRRAAIEHYGRALSVAPPGWRFRELTEGRLARARAALADREGGR